MLVAAGSLFVWHFWDGRGGVLKPDGGPVADAGGVRVVAIAEYGDIDQVRRRRIRDRHGFWAKLSARPAPLWVGNTENSGRAHP